MAAKQAKASVDCGNISMGAALGLVFAKIARDARIKVIQAELSNPAQ